MVGDDAPDLSDVLSAERGLTRHALGWRPMPVPPGHVGRVKDVPFVLYLWKMLSTIFLPVLFWDAKNR